MSIRKNIAAALRKRADQASARAIAAFLAATQREREQHATQRLISAALWFGYVRRVADLLDPDGHAPASRADHHARGVAPAPSARASVGGVEQAARSAAADAQGGQGEQGSTEAARLARERAERVEARRVAAQAEADAEARAFGLPHALPVLAVPSMNGEDHIAGFVAQRQVIPPLRVVKGGSA